MQAPGHGCRRAMPRNGLLVGAAWVIVCLTAGSAAAASLRPSLLNLFPAWLYDVGPYGKILYIVVTLLLGGAAAFVSGRAMALTWRPRWMIVPAMVLLAAAVRFVQFAVFQATLVAPLAYLVDLASLLAIAAVGYAATRKAQMIRQYGWIA